MWRKRRWRYLLLRIDHLPRNSAYVEAVSLDEELAAEAAKGPRPKAGGPRMRDWSPELELLTAIADRLGDVVQAVIAVQGGKPPRIRPLPRPQTATDKLNDPREKHRRILSKVLIAQPDGSVLSAAEMSAHRGPGPRAALH